MTSHVWRIDFYWDFCVYDWYWLRLPRELGFPHCVVVYYEQMKAYGKNQSFFVISQQNHGFLRFVFKGLRSRSSFVERRVFRKGEKIKRKGEEKILWTNLPIFKLLHVYIPLAKSRECTYKFFWEKFAVTCLDIYNFKT